MSNEVLHIGGRDKFLTPFISLIEVNFDFRKHQFLLRDGLAEKHAIKAPNVHLYKRTIVGRLNYYFQAVIKMHQADKVVLHGLFDMKFVFVLFWMPWVLRKCYWVIWGGDLYVYQLGKRNWKWKLGEFFRRAVIKRTGHLVTYIEGDVALARMWYGAKGKHHECIMYLSNVVVPEGAPETTTKSDRVGLNILLGNSADPSNNHRKALERLLRYKDQNIKIYAPLSYGDQAHAKKVIALGKDWFGDKFIPMTDFMPFEQYRDFLKKLDIAIFNHQRQQAMGNTITLLGMGKTVFMRSDVTQWGLLNSLGVKVFDVSSLALQSLNSDEANNNACIIHSYFSRATLIRQLSDIFEV